MDLKLSGKRALVTGSTAGIGAEIARTLAAEGAAVAVNGRSERRGLAVVEEIRAAGGTAVLALGDVATDEGGAAAFAAVAKGLGDVDIIINNAAGFAGGSSVSNPFTIPPEAWSTTLGMNVGAAIRVIQHFAPGMVERGWGRIINISSAAAQAPSGETSDYAAAKAALANMSMSVARHLAYTGVTVNLLTPGITVTRSVKAWMRQIGEQQGWGDDEAKSTAHILKNLSPQMVTRLGQPEDIANMAAYLASPVADFITGTNINVHGGALTTIF